MICWFFMPLLVSSVTGIPIEDFLPFNGHDGENVCIMDYREFHTTNCSEYRFNPGDDFTSPSITIPIIFPFFGRNFTNVFVSQILIIKYCSIC